MSSDRRARERRGKVDMSAWAKKAEQGYSTAYKFPEGVELYKPTDGVHDIDFMNFIAGSRNPDADEGFEICQCKFVVHKIPGPDGKQRPYCCLWECFKEECPACRRVGRGLLTPEQAELIKPQVRRLWLLNDMPGDDRNPPGSKKNPWKVMDSNHFNRGRGFGEMVTKEITLDPKFRSFADYDGGYTARIRFEKASFMGRNYVEATRIDFMPRKYSYPDSLLDEAPCLDDFLIHTDAEEMDRLLDGGIAVADAEEAEAPTRRREEPERPRRAREDNGHHEERPVSRERPAPRPEKEEAPPRKAKSNEKTAEDCGIKKGSIVYYTPPDEDKPVECDVLKVSADGLTLLLEGDNRERYDDVSPADCKVWRGREQEQEKPAPKPAPKKPVPVDGEEVDRPTTTKNRTESARKTVEDDDDIVDDEDDEPAPRKRREEPDDDEDDAPPPRKATAAKKVEDDDDDLLDDDD